MPRLTRDQQFRESFIDFLVETEDSCFPDLKEWKLECLTKNKTSSLHEYRFQIPKKTIIFTIDAHTDANGVQHPAESIEGEQTIPTLYDFYNQFHRYFDPHVLKQFNSIVSYTSLVSENYNENGDLVAEIVVCYYRSFLPYPSKHKTYEQLQEKCDHLSEENKYLSDTVNEYIVVLESKNKKIKKLKERVKEINADATVKLRETIHNMQKKIRECYEELRKEEDCPVCYECIKSSNLMVPSCCHYICGTCYDRCDSCPICREVFA